MLLQRIVALDEHLQAKTARRIAHLDPFELPKTPIYGLASNGRLNTFDAEEVLLIQRSKPFKVDFEVGQFVVEFLRIQSWLTIERSDL